MAASTALALLQPSILPARRPLRQKQFLTFSSLHASCPGCPLGGLQTGTYPLTAVAGGQTCIHASRSDGPALANSSSLPSDPKPAAPLLEGSSKPPLEQGQPISGRRQQAESTDWIASTLTRRFGLGAGFAWVGFLAFGVISEQIKTRTEVYIEERETKDVEDAEEIITPEGIRYWDLRVGGGSSPLRGDLVIIGLTGKVAGTDSLFVNTYATGNRDIVFAFGLKPYVKGVCDGLEWAMRGMKAGGKRRIIVPPELGFGSDGADFGQGVLLPGNAALEYVVELKRVSIAP